MDHHNGANSFIHGLKHRKENQLLSLEHYWLSICLVRESDNKGGPW